MRILKLKFHHLAFEPVDITLNIHQKIVLGFVLVNFVVFMYDSLFHLIVEIVHGLFESTEHILDILVGHLLETSTHETQVIVFYTLFSFILLGLYRLYRFLPRWYESFKKNLHQQKLATLSEWYRLPLIQRFEWWSFFVVYLAGFVFLSF